MGQLEPAALFLIGFSNSGQIDHPRKIARHFFTRLRDLAAFQQARGAPYVQSALACALPALKWALKVLVKRAVTAGDNPDFAHGAAYVVELEVAVLCAVIFTNIDSWVTFALLMAMDLVVNLGPWSLLLSRSGCKRPHTWWRL